MAWSVGNTERWWQPGVYWPAETHQDDYGLGILVEAFRSLGFEECDEGGLERGYEKVALYGSTFLYTHAARQLPSGKWTSKLWRSVRVNAPVGAMRQKSLFQRGLRNSECHSSQEPFRFENGS